MRKSWLTPAKSMQSEEVTDDNDDYEKVLTQHMVGVGTVQGDVDGGDVVVGVGHMTMASILHMTQATSSRQI